MNTVLRYILIALGIALGIFIIWRFSHIVTYIIISAILSLVGRPMVDLLGKLKIKNWHLPKSISALLTLLTLWVFFLLFFSLMIPLISSELHQLSAIDSNVLLSTIQTPFEKLDQFFGSFIFDNNERITVESFIARKLNSLFNAGFATSVITNVASMLGNVFLAMFSVTFITFFFLKDESMFTNVVLAMVPDKHVESFKHAMLSARHLLIRYFIGITLQVTGIFTLLTAGLTIVGVGFHHSLIIALIAATMNTIPYLGPLIGGSVGIILGIATHLQLDLYSELLPLTGWMLLIFIITQLTDNFIFQPFIYSSSVKAHPLEIFIVILVAASIGGVIGMIVAIPLYTIIRVFAKEFFNKFKVVKKLTQKIE